MLSNIRIITRGATCLRSGTYRLLQYIQPSPTTSHIAITSHLPCTCHSAAGQAHKAPARLVRTHPSICMCMQTPTQGDSTIAVINNQGKGVPAGFSTSAHLPLSRPIAVTDQESTHQAYACMQATPTQGEYSTIAGIDNSGKGLPAGFSNKPLSASQLAAIQAASVTRTQSDAATVATPNAGTTDGGSQQVLSPSCIHQSTLQPCKLLTELLP